MQMWMNLFLSRLLFLSVLISLTGCREWIDPDPVCGNWTPAEPSHLWVPDDFDPVPSYEEDALCSGDDVQQPHRKLGIADLIDTALSNNPTTKQTWAQARAAAFGVRIAESACYPTVDFQQTFTYQDFRLDRPQPPPVTAMTPLTPPPLPSSTTSLLSLEPLLDPKTALRQQIGNLQPGQTGNPVASAIAGPTASLNNNLSISYLLLDFGGRAATIEAARQALYISDWTHNRQIQLVILSVLQNYYVYEGLVHLLKARQTDLKNAQTNLEAAKQLFEAGIKNKLDVLQAQSELINTELNIVDLEGQSKITLSNLITTLGLPGYSKIEIEQFPEGAPLDEVNENIEQLVATAIEQRADLAAAYANREQRKAEVTIARSAGLPTLSTNAIFQNNIYFQNPSFNNRSFTGSVALNFPLFNGFFYLSQTRQAEELLRSASANIRYVELGVIADVMTSYYNFKTAVESVKYSDEYLKYSEEAYEAALLTYKEGIGTILDLLSAQRTLANAHAQRVQARTKWAVALAQIAFSTGTIGAK